MLLLRNGEFVADTFVALGESEAATATGGVLVSWQRLRREFDALAARPGPLGVVFPVDAEPDELRPCLAALALVALPFAGFADGRAFSLARIIRARLGFTGELRAVGDILPDQISYLRQVGFDSFAPRDGRVPADTWLRAATSMSLTYQTGYVPARGFSPAEIFELRKGRGA